MGENNEGTGMNIPYNPYRSNSQACVIAYEMRRRGYDVEAKGNDKGKYFEQLSCDPALAWIDPETEKAPKPEMAAVSPDPLGTYQWLKKELVPGRRYAIWFLWRDFPTAGHIVCVRKNDDGDVELYDPQSGKIEATGKEEMKDYFSHVSYKLKFQGQWIETPPLIIRMDNMIPNTDILNHVLQPAGASQKFDNMEGYDFAADTGKTWNGYRVYYMGLSKMVYVGKPIFALVKDNQVRLNAPNETWEISSSILPPVSYDEKDDE